MYAEITLNTMQAKAIEVEVEAKRKAASSKVANAVVPNKGANKFAQERPPRNGEPPARNSKPPNTKQRAGLVNIEQKIGQNKEDYKQFSEVQG